MSIFFHPLRLQAECIISLGVNKVNTMKLQIIYFMMFFTIYKSSFIYNLCIVYA
ncbi:hypothetical protein XBJ2_1560034 [Xenorhabdus bovienii str. Jollieti]|nr:hypothetical protein XBJ2_1560034 [Xenorhabdus bovienii str. Jollieti]